jgi:hypothetical protein
MAVLPSKHFSDSYTPVCNSCGIHLCWDLEGFQYENEKPFWDEWECRDCNSEYEGSLTRWKQLNTRSFWISLSYATFGIESLANKVTDAAPIAKWMVDKTLQEIKPWLLSKKAKVVELKPDFYPPNHSDLLSLTDLGFEAA